MDGYITIGTELETKEFDKQIAELEKQLQAMEQDYDRALKAGAKVDDAPMRKLATETEKARNKLVGLYNQKMKLQKSGGFDLMNSSLASAMKKAGKLALGIFSIRSAYMALRRASSDLASYDPQYATNLEYIRWVLTQAIAPVLKWIVNTVGTILQYIYAILNAWFGLGARLDLSAESFNKMKKGASGVSKAVKQIKRDLLGFDEVNRLTSQSDTGTSAGAGGVGIPDFDLGGLKEVPEWLQWIMDNKDKVLGILTAIGAIIGAYKIATFLASLQSVVKLFRGLFAILPKIVTAFKGLSALQLAGVFTGIAIAIVGIVKTIQGLIKFIDDPSWENFREVLGGIEITLIGVGIAMVALNASNPVGWILLAVGAVIEYITALTKDEAQILSVADAQKELEEAIKKTNDATLQHIDAVKAAEEAQKRLEEVQRLNKISGEELQKQIDNGTLSYEKMNNAQREVYEAYVKNESAQQKLKDATENLTQAKHTEELQHLNTALSTARETENMEEWKQTVIDAWKANKIETEEARTLFERSMHDMSAEAAITFGRDIPKEIKEGLDPTKYSSPINRFKMAMEGLYLSIKNGLKNAFKINASVNVSGSSGGGRAKGGIFYPSKMPKLAVGGIINMPGRGMPYNGAIIGERGAEAVVPLTDSQQMELLGETIGRYITINANIVNTMNGRVISRELRQVQNNQDFAYNT